MRLKGFIGPSYTSESKIAAYDETANWYPERIESGTGQAEYVLYPTPGVEAIITGVDSPGRGAFFAVDRGYYFVSGSTFYQSTTTVRGTGLSNASDAPVSIIYNGDAGQQLLINADDSTYAYDTGTHVFTDVTGSTQATSIGFLNGYGLRLDPNRSEVSFSALEDFTSWDALDVFQRNDAADRWQRLLVNHKEIWLFGTDTTSVYRNGDNTDTPFEPIGSVFVQMGIAAPFSACIVDDSPFWLGRGSVGVGIVYRARGYTPERISTHAIEFAISEIQALGVDLSTAEGSTYQERGHLFYELTFPADDDIDFAGRTYVYDLTSGLWHRRGEPDGLDFGCVGTRGHILSGDNQTTLSRTEGIVYSQSIAFPNGTSGAGIVRLRRAPHIAQEHKGVVIDTFELHLETGLGLVSGQGSDPVIAVRWSNNGGQTWSNTRTMRAGKLGEWSTRAITTGLGYGRDRIIEVRCSDPIPWRLIDAYIDVRVGAS